MKKMRLFSKTFLYTMAFMTVIIIIFHLLLYFLMPDVYLKEKQNEIADIVDRTKSEMKDKTLEQVLSLAETYIQNEGVNISVITENKTYIYSSFAMKIKGNPKQNKENKMMAIENDAKKKNSFVVGNENDKNIKEKHESQISMNSSKSLLSKNLLLSESMLERNLDITLHNKEKVVVTISMNLQAITEASNVMFHLLPYTISICILISICAAFFYTRAITRPIKSICTATKDMEQLKKDAICVVKSNDEIGELASDINNLYAALQGTIHSLEHELIHVSKVEQTKIDFLRSASHELKTPLSSLRLIIESMILNIGKYQNHDIYLEKCKGIIDQLTMMIKDILDASSLQEISKHEQKEDIDVVTWIEKISEPYILIAKTKGLKWKLHIEHAFIIQQNKTLMSNVLSNVLANAVQYTQREGLIKIVIKDYKIIIENECCPIADEHLQHLSEAFYRPDFSRTKSSGGNGLGLYFVDQTLHMLQIPYTFTSYEHGMRFIMDCAQIDNIK